MKNDFNILRKEFINGKEQLEIFKEYGTLSENTDFAILLGALSIRDKDDKKNIGLWWTRSKYYNNEVYVINQNGRNVPFYPYIRDIATRPAIRYSSIAEDSKLIYTNNNVGTIIYGEYPQDIVEHNFSYELESMYNMKLLNTTGKLYTVDANLTTDYNSSFDAASYVEFEYKRKKFIRYIANCDNVGKSLSDGRIIVYNGIYWIEVSPILWYVDIQRDIAITKKSIISGIQFNNKSYVHNHFYKNDIKNYMDSYLSNEIIPDNKNIKKLIK